MKVIVYCTTNIINKFIYIGVHICKSEKFDGYIGCGVYINQPSTYNHPKTAFQYAVQKYGPNNFKRITIKEFDNEEDAYYFENEIVNESFLTRKDVYNQVIGGKGGDNLVGNSIPCFLYDLDGNYINCYESQQKAAIAVNRGYSVIKYAIKNKSKCANFFWSLEKVNKLNLSEFKTTDNKVPVYLYSESGEYDCCYESVSDAARVNNVASTNISRACKLGYKCGNKYFSYDFNSTFTKVRTETTKGKHIYLYSLNGEFIKEWKSCNLAEQELNLKRGLSTALKLKRVFGGFQWSLEKLERMESKEFYHSARKVGQYDLQGNLIKIFNSVTDCTKEFSGCRHVLLGRNKTSGGYVFKYID